MNRCVQHMIWGVVWCLLWVVPCKTVQAGDLNPDEQAVLDAAKGPFYYDGEEYVPTDASMQMLEDYMTQDDVDLTEEEAEKAIQKGRNSVADGIAQGYLVPAAEGGGEQSTAPREPGPSEPAASEPAPSESAASESAPPESAASQTAAEETRAAEETQSEAQSLPAAEESEPRVTSEPDAGEETSIPAGEASVGFPRQGNIQPHADENRDGAFQKGVDVVFLSLILAAAVAVVGAAVVLRHRNRFGK